MKANKYLDNIFCNKHPDERLNIVCINKKCPNRGLLCQLCRNDKEEFHYLHPDEILPFKYFLESLQANTEENQSQFSSFVENSCLSRLQKLRDEMLSRLAITIQQLARLVGDLEMRIINDFQIGKQNIRQKGLVFRQYKQVIDRCIIHNIRKEEKFELIAEIRKIVGQVRPIQGKNSKNKYHLDLNGKLILVDFMQKNERLKMDCERLELQFNNIFGNNREKQNAKILLKYQQQMLKKEIYIVEAENRGLSQSKRKAEQLKLSKLQDQRLYKKKQQKQKKKEKKKQQQQKKSKKQVKSTQTKKDQLIQKVNSLLPNAIKQVALDFIPKQPKIETKETVVQSIKKQPKISFAEFAGKEMQIEKQIIKDKDLGLKSLIFSSLFKGISIKIAKSGRVAKQTISQEKIAGFAVASQTLDKCKKIGMRIIKIKDEVSLGIVRHQVIAANKYAFNMNAEGHGAYMINSKGIAYSSAFPEENKHQKQFGFEEGDIVNLIFDEGTLYFERIPHKKSINEAQEVSLSIGMNIADAKSFNFCVFLNGNGDSVQLI